MTRLGQELLGLGRIVDGGRRLPVEVEGVGNDTSGDPGEAKGQCLVDGLVIDGQAGGEPHALVMPWRFRIPLVGEVEPECRLDDGRLEGEPLGALQLLGELAADRVGNIDLAALEGSQPRGLVGDHPEHQSLYVGRLAPILIEGLHGQLQARRK